MPLQYPYPENGWSTGRMRKRGEKIGGEYDVAMDIQRRGQPELSGGPGIAEAEALAGAGRAARGGTSAATRADVTAGARGISPDVIAQQKAEFQMKVADRLRDVGQFSLKKMQKWAHENSMEMMLEAADPTGMRQIGWDMVWGAENALRVKMGKKPLEGNSWDELTDQLKGKSLNDVVDMLKDQYGFKSINLRLSHPQGDTSIPIGSEGGEE